MEALFAQTLKRNAVIVETDKDGDVSGTKAPKLLKASDEDGGFAARINAITTTAFPSKSKAKTSDIGGGDSANGAPSAGAQPSNDKNKAIYGPQKQKASGGGKPKPSAKEKANRITTVVQTAAGKQYYVTDERARKTEATVSAKLEELCTQSRQVLMSLKDEDAFRLVNPPTLRILITKLSKAMEKPTGTISPEVQDRAKTVKRYKQQFEDVVPLLEAVKSKGSVKSTRMYDLIVLARQHGFEIPQSMYSVAFARSAQSAFDDGFNFDEHGREVIDLAEWVFCLSVSEQAPPSQEPKPFGLSALSLFANEDLVKCVDAKLADTKDVASQMQAKFDETTPGDDQHEALKVHLGQINKKLILDKQRLEEHENMKRDAMLCSLQSQAFDRAQCEILKGGPFGSDETLRLLLARVLTFLNYKETVSPLLKSGESIPSAVTMLAQSKSK
jgi:hypothetical protein